MSSFTNWNGPQGGPTKDMWQELINEYKELLDSSNYVKKDGNKVLTDVNFTQALYDKLNAINQTTASKDIGNIASGSQGLVTGDAVFQFCKDFATKVAGQGFSTNDFSNDYKGILESIKSAASCEVALSLTDDEARLVTVAIVKNALEGYVAKEAGKGLSSNDFTDEYIRLLSIFTEYNILFNWKSFGAFVGGSNDRGVYYILGQLDERAGTAYIRLTNTKSFAAVVHFAVTKDTTLDDYLDGQLSITTDVDSAELSYVHFLIVKGTNSDGEHHAYLAIQADEWMKRWNESGIVNAGVFGTIEFEGSGINFIPVNGEGFVRPNNTTEVLLDVDYYGLEDRMSAMEEKLDTITSDDGIGTISNWPKYDENGVAIDVPDWAHACDGSDIPDDADHAAIRAIVGTEYPLQDYAIIRIKKVISYD